MVQGNCCICGCTESKKFLNPPWAEGSVCLSCYKRDQREKHRDKDAATKAAWYQRNKEHCVAKNKQWKQDNAEYAAAYQAAYRAKHADKRKEYKKNYYLEHKQEYSEAAKLRYQKNKEDIIAKKHQRRLEIRKQNILAQGVTEEELNLMVDETANLDSIFEEVADEV